MPPKKKPPKKPNVKDTKKKPPKKPTVKPGVKDTEAHPNMPDDGLPFTLANLQSLPNLLGPRKAPTIANFNNLKMAFQPFGQSDKNPLSARKQAEWKQQLKSFKTTGAKTWPHEVPSFELWAAATSYIYRTGRSNDPPFFGYSRVCSPSTDRDTGLQV